MKTRKKSRCEQNIYSSSHKFNVLSKDDTITITTATTTTTITTAS